jgi:hypothetical protein
MPAMIPGGHLSEDGRSIVVELAAGTPETGIWCGECLLPSGVRVPIFTLTDDGPRRLAWADFHKCTDCGGFV